MSDIDDQTKQRHVVNAVEAREQASEGAYSFLRSEFRRVKPSPEHPEGEVFEIPHKDLFDNDQQERWDDLLAEMRTYDREPDVLNAEGKVIFKGMLIQPHLKNGKRVKPSWPERLAIVLWGEDGAKRAKAGGLNFNEIEVVWAKQDREMKRRNAEDSKSAAGGPAVAPASSGD